MTAEHCQRTQTLLLAATASALLYGCTTPDDAPIVGLLESDRIELAAEFAEPVRARHVREGEQVAQGTLLIEQDSSRWQAMAAESAALVAESQARLDELLRGPRREQISAARADVAGAREEADFQDIEYKRALDVFEKNLAARETVDRAKAARDVARSQLAASEARLEELLAGTTVEELRQAEQRLEQRRAQLAARRIDIERLSLNAPLAATVDTLLFEPGELPTPGNTVVVLLAGTQPYARIYIPEALRVQVQPGTQVTVHVDGLDNGLPGRVRWVSADPAFTPYFALTEHDRGRLTYAAKVDIDFAGKRLPDGIPVQVEIDLSSSAAPE